jgi:hypothetical protein
MKKTGAYYDKTRNGFVPGTVIYRNRPKGYVIDMSTNQRKTIKEIAQLIHKKKEIPISRESARRFIANRENEG